jgi:chromosome segregation ATPase
MATDTTTLRGANLLADEALRLARPNRDWREVDAPPPHARPQNGNPPNIEEPHAPHAAAASQDLILGPLVDHVAFGFARVLVAAMRELEAHIANENQKLGDNVGERLDSLQASVNDLAGAVSEQRSASRAIMDKCEALDATTISLQEADRRRQEEIAVLRADALASAGSTSARIDSAVAELQQSDARQSTEIASVRGLMDTQANALRESDARQQSDVLALRSETKAFSASVAEQIEALHGEIAVQQEDIAALKSGLSTFSLRVDGLLERIDKQAEAVHTMYLTYAQRESELEHLIEGLTRLRSVPSPPPANRL